MSKTTSFAPLEQHFHYELIFWEAYKLRVVCTTLHISE